MSFTWLFRKVRFSTGRIFWLSLISIICKTCSILKYVCFYHLLQQSHEVRFQNTLFLIRIKCGYQVVLFVQSYLKRLLSMF